MIDVEVSVFDYVRQFVAEVVPEGCFRSQYTPSPSKFPFATLEESGNITNARFRTNSDDEDNATLTYEANVYAMDKRTCRQVLDVLDKAMMRLNFRRNFMDYTNNLNNPELFRITARYIADVDKTGRLSRN